MSVLTSAEEKKRQEIKDERRQALEKTVQFMASSFLVGIKLGGFMLLTAIVVYFFAKYLLQWDLFYETDVKYPSLCFKAVVFLLVIMILCWIGAFILYNTKHKRNTKYKE